MLGLNINHVSKKGPGVPKGLVVIDRRWQYSAEIKSLKNMA